MKKNFGFLLCFVFLTAAFQANADCRMSNSALGFGEKIILKIDRDTGIEVVVDKYVCQSGEGYENQLRCFPTGVLGGEQVGRLVLNDDGSKATLYYRTTTHIENGARAEYVANAKMECHR